MVRRLWPLVSAIMAVAVLSCATNSQSEPRAHDDRDCRGDCVQPPLRQSDLVDHLRAEQERILQREDYKQLPQPSAMDIIFGPIPSDYLREGPAPVCEAGEEYDGRLSWHYMPFEEVQTEQASYRPLRGREVAGAHCFFAHKPNRLTPIFAVLAHRRSGGDALYIGGPHQRVISVDASPLTRGMGPIEINTDQLHCAFRHDQNQMGAVIVAFDYRSGPQANSGPHYAVFTVTTYGRKQPTGKSMIVERASGLPGGHTIPIEVPVLKYPKARAQFVAQSTDLRRALEEAEGAIISGEFRLRPEFVYPKMPYQSYLDTGAEEFCPVNTTCRTPPAHLDVDIFPSLPAYNLSDYMDLGDDDASEEADLDTEATSQ